MLRKAYKQAAMHYYESDDGHEDVLALIHEMQEAAGAATLRPGQLGLQVGAAVGLQVW